MPERPFDSTFHAPADYTFADCVKEISNENSDFYRPNRRMAFEYKGTSYVPIDNTYTSFAGYTGNGVTKKGVYNADGNKVNNGGRRSRRHSKRRSTRRRKH